MPEVGTARVNFQAVVCWRVVTAWWPVALAAAHKKPVLTGKYNVIVFVMAKHEIISRELRGEIAAGKYGASGQLPSETQLCERFGVSRPTVARALRDLQDEDLIGRQAGSGSFVRQRTETQNTTTVLGLLVPERGTTEIFDAICGELGALARMQGYGLLWGSSPLPHVDCDASPSHAEQVCREFINKQITGVFFAPLEVGTEAESANRSILNLFQQAGIPVILLDRDITPYPNRSGCDLVTMDNFSAGYMLAEHLIRLGCKKLRFMARSGSASTVYARLSGVREAIHRFGLKENEEIAVWGDPNNLEFVSTIRAGKSCDGIICANDLAAAQLLRSLRELKVKVPSGVRVAGFDDVRYATLLPVELTTIHQPCRDIAEVAFRAMQERIRVPTAPIRTLSLAPRLVVRESCGAYLR